MRKPLHSAITDALRTRIHAGEWAEGSRLPTEPVLAVELGISRPTLREALKQLQTEGLVDRRHGIGTFVREVRPGFDLDLSMPRSVTALIAGRGFLPGTSAMTVATETVFPDDVERLEVQPGSKVFRIERVRTANGQPVAYTIDTVPAWAMNVYPELDADGRFSLVEHLARCGIRLQHSTSYLQPLHNVKSVADRLDLDPASHLFFLEGIDHAEDGRPVVFSREYFAPWIFRFTVTRTP